MQMALSVSEWVYTGVRVLDESHTIEQDGNGISINSTEPLR
jgi:hypothetical protein